MILFYIAQQVERPVAHSNVVCVSIIKDLPTATRETCFEVLLKMRKGAEQSLELLFFESVSRETSFTDSIQRWL